MERPKKDPGHLTVEGGGRGIPRRSSGSAWRFIATGLGFDPWLVTKTPQAVRCGQQVNE